MIANVGLVKSIGIIAALIIAVSMLPTLVLQWKGSLWRKNTQEE